MFLPGSKTRSIMRVVPLIFLAVVLSVSQLLAGPPEEKVYDFSIPAGPLESVLNQFVRITGTNLAYADQFPQTAQSAGVKGRYPAETALQTILGATGITAKQQNGGGFILLTAPQATAKQPTSEQQKNKTEESEHQQARMEMKLENMTVTAQKQEENIQDVPMGITAFTAQGIEDAKIESISDLADFVPSLSVFSQGGSGMNAPSMRGVSAPWQTMDLSTGLFIDGVPVQSVLGFDSTFLDIERVEVLRGPQGTLYGKNTEAGAINIITRQPDNNFNGSVSVNIGTLLSSETDDDPLTQTYTVKLSSPIQKDKLFLGIAAKFHQKDGFIENTATGEDEADREHWFGRAHLRWTPTDQLDISFVASQTEYNDGAYQMNLSEYEASQYGLPAPDYRKVSSNFKAENDSSQQTQSLKIDYEMNDAFQLTSVTSRRVYEHSPTNDWDFSSVTFSHADKVTESTTLSQELRLNYDNGGVKWIAGVYGDKNEGEDNAVTLTRVRHSDSDGSTYAVFTNLTYPLSQRFSLTGGLRYETAEKEINTSAKHLDDSWDAITPKLALEYRILPGIMTYISASKGYRAGGFNSSATDSEYVAYDEEELWSYEIGAKNIFFNNRLIVNACIYLMDISDMQVSQKVTPTTSYLTNAAEATAKGVELELTGKITSGLTIMAGIGYTHLEFDDFKDEDGDYQGNKTPYSPEYTFNIGAQYRWENGLYARADLVGYGEMYFDKANEYNRDAYQIVNAKIGYETEHFDVYLYGKNIFDEEYDSYGCYNGFNTIYSDPGEVGLQVTYRF